MFCYLMISKWILILGQLVVSLSMHSLSNGVQAAIEGNLNYKLTTLFSEDIFEYPADIKNIFAQQIQIQNRFSENDSAANFYSRVFLERIDKIFGESHSRFPESDIGKCGILDSCILRCGDSLFGPPYVCSCDLHCILFNDCCFDALKYCPKEQFSTNHFELKTYAEYGQVNSVSSCVPTHVFPYYGFWHKNGTNLDRVCTYQEPPWCAAENEKGLPRQSLSILLNFGPPGWNNKLIAGSDYGQPDPCPKAWEIWDPFSDVCRPVKCGDNYKEENGKCIWNPENAPKTDDLFRYETTSINISLTGFVLSASDETLILNYLNKKFLPSLAKRIGLNESRLTDLDLDRIYNDGEVFTIPPEVMFTEFQDGSKKPELIISDDGFPVKINFTLQKATNQSESEIIEKEMEEVLSILNEAVSKSTIVKLVNTDIFIRLIEIERLLNREEHYFFEMWCRGGDLEYSWNDEFELRWFKINQTETTNETVVMKVFIHTTNKIYEEGEYIANILSQSVDFTEPVANISGVVVVCENRPFILDESCLRISLNDTEFSTKADDKVLYYDGEIRGIKRVLNYTDYYYDFERFVVVCVDLDKAKEYLTLEMTLIQEIASWTSFILIILSLIALLATILVYIILPELQTGPGWCLVNFCLADFVFFLLFTFGLQININTEDLGKIDPLCFGIAIALHYSSILLFVWSTIISFDLYQTFSNCLVAAVTKTHSLKWYLIFGYSVPAIIIFSCLMLEFRSVELKPEYGIRICWFGNSMVALYFFAIPIAICILINFTLFIFTIRAIQKTSADTSQLRVRNKNRFKLFARMSSVMCFGWIFGYLTVGFQWDLVTARILEFFFIILNALQGVYVFLAFVVNSRVKNLLYNRIKCILPRGYNRSSSVSSSPYAHAKLRRETILKSKLSVEEQPPKILAKYSNAKHRRSTPTGVERSVSNETMVSHLSADSS